MKTAKSDKPAPPETEVEAQLQLKRSYLRITLAVSGGHSSSPAATKVAGAEAAKLKTEIAELEQQLHPQAA